MEPSTIPTNSGQTRYAVFELYAECARCILITVQPEGQVVVEQVITAAAPMRFSENGYKAAAEELLTKVQISDDAHLIVIFDRNEAVAMQSALSLQRADWGAEITMPELENAIRHGVWQLFQQDRATAAKLLKTTDIQLRLADVDVVQLKLDGHRVMSPIGFRAQTIDVVLRETFVRAEPWTQLTSLLPVDRILAVVERSGFWAGSAAVAAKSEGLFLDIGEHQTFIFNALDSTTSFDDSVQWGSSGMFESVTKPLGLPVSLAPALIELYASGKVSELMGAHIEDALKQEFAVLLHTIEAHRTHRNVPVYVHSIVALPPLLSQDKLMRKLGVGTPYITLSEETAAGTTIPVVHYERSVHRGGLTPSYDTALALVMRSRVPSIEALATKTAKQRARWIGSVG